MTKRTRETAAVCSLWVLCAAAGVGAETVVSKSKITGGRVQSAFFQDFGAGVGVSVTQTVLMDGTDAVIVQWMGPDGGAAGSVPASAISLRGDRIDIHLDVTLLPPGAMVWGNPGTCVGTFAAAPDDGQTAVQWTETSGTQSTRFFQPFWGLPGGTGYRYETTTTGRTFLGTARFTGTCGGVLVSEPAPWQMGSMQAHVGNITQVITLVP